VKYCDRFNLMEHGAFSESRNCVAEKLVELMVFDNSKPAFR
jgi:hypothetical protein